MTLGIGEAQASGKGGDACMTVVTTNWPWATAMMVVTTVQIPTGRLKNMEQASSSCIDYWSEAIVVDI